MDVQSLIKEYQDGNEEAGNDVIVHLSPYIKRIVRSLVFPECVNRDELEVDAITACWKALKGYNPEQANVKTYLHTAIVRECVKSAQFQLKGVGNDVFEGDFLAREDTDFDEFLDKIQEVVADIPHDQITEEARQVLALMLKGKSVSHIADLMEWDRAHASRFIESTRKHLAWRLVRANVSAEPFISDKSLKEMAEQYKDENVGLF